MATSTRNKRSIPPLLRYARKFEADGDIPASLQRWRAILAISSDHVEAVAAVLRLEATPVEDADGASDERYDRERRRRIEAEQTLLQESERLDESRRSLAQAVRQIAVAEAATRARFREVAELQAQRDELAKSQSESEAALDNAASQNNELSGQIAELSAAGDTTTRALEVALAELSRATERTDELETELQSAEADRDVVVAELKQVEEAKTRADSALLATRTEHADVSERLGSVSSQLSELENTHAALQNTLQQKESDLASALEDNSAVSVKLATVSASIADIEAVAEDLKESWKTEQERVSQLQSELDETNSAFKTVKAELRASAVRVESLHKEAAAQAESIADLNELLAERTVERDALRELATTTAERAEQLETEVTSLTQERDRLLERVDENTASNLAFQKQAEELSSDLGELRGENSSLARQLDDALARTVELEADVERVQALVVARERANEQIQLELSDAESDLASVRTAHMRTRSTLEETASALEQASVVLSGPHRVLTDDMDHDTGPEASPSARAADSAAIAELTTQLTEMRDERDSAVVAVNTLEGQVARLSALAERNPYISAGSSVSVPTSAADNQRIIQAELVIEQLRQQSVQHEERILALVAQAEVARDEEIKAKAQLEVATASIADITSQLDHARDQTDGLYDELDAGTSTIESIGDERRELQEALQVERKRVQQLTGEVAAVPDEAVFRSWEHREQVALDEVASLQVRLRDMEAKLADADAAVAEAAQIQDLVATQRAVIQSQERELKQITAELAHRTANPSPARSDSQRDWRFETTASVESVDRPAPPQHDAGQELEDLLDSDVDGFDDDDQLAATGRGENVAMSTHVGSPGVHFAPAGGDSGGDEPDEYATTTEQHTRGETTRKRRITETSGRPTGPVPNDAETKIPDAILVADGLAGGDSMPPLERLVPLMEARLRAPAEMTSLDIGPKDAFLLEQLDGSISVRDLIEVSGLPRVEAAARLCDLVQRKIIKL